MLTGGLGHERGRRVEVGQYTSAAEGTGQTPHPGDTLSGGGSWEGGLEVGARQDERGPGSKAPAPQMAAP